MRIGAGEARSRPDIQPIEKSYRQGGTKRLPQGCTIIHTLKITGQATGYEFGSSMTFRGEMSDQIARCEVRGESSDHRAPSPLLRGSNQFLEFRRQSRLSVIAPSLELPKARRPNNSNP